MMQNMRSERKKQILDIIFYMAIVIELMIVILEKSAYIIRYEGYWFRLTFILFAVKAFFNKYTLKEWAGFVVAGVVAIISYRVTGRNEMLRVLVLIAACKDMEPKRLLKTIFWTTLSGCIVLMVLSLTGVMGTVAITAEFRVGKVETRYCFGLQHPNGFHCMVWALVTLGCYIYKEKVKLFHYVLLFAGNIVVYMFTLSRTAVIVTTFVIVLYAVVYCCKRISNWRLFYIGCACMIIASLIITIILSETVYTVPLVGKLNEKLSLRIFGITWTENAMPGDWTLFGLASNTKYFDMGVARLFYWYGWIPALIYLTMNIHLICIAYKKRDVYLAILVATFMIYTVIEAHLISDYLLRNYIYVLYGLALTVSDEEKETKKQYYLWDIVNSKRGVKCEQ